MDQNFLTQQICIPESFESEFSQDDKSLILTEIKEKSSNEHLTDSKNFPNNRHLNLTASLPKNDFFSNIFSLTNNYIKLIRICSFIFRFLNRCKKLEPQPTGPLTSLELKASESSLIKQVKRFSFFEDKKKFRKSEVSIR